MRQYTSKQMEGSEYSGVERTTATIQPKDAKAVEPAEQLRLTYLTGEPTDTESLEDRRQFWGLRPADGRPPKWLTHTGQTADVELEHPELFE